ncbi:hypothetical protein [Streptococcus agalactiae]|uniref:hypothetical protein n=1 Tax=Streptococcus agalactiae TaxID=1311 RepID=UPI00362581B4
MELLLKLTGNSESLVLQIYDIDTKGWEERISLEKVEEGFFVKSKIANLEYHTNNMNLKILSLTLICIP